MHHLAIDLETLSLKPNAHILSIGAVFFCPRTKRLGSQFHIVINPEAEQVGAHISASTVNWWFNQIVFSRELAFNQCPQEYRDLTSAIQLLVDWVHANRSGNEELSVYQQGSLDSVWLESAGDRTGVKMPWRYNRVYCARTLWDHTEPTASPYRNEGVEHNALQDAMDVAFRMMELPNL